MAAPRRPFRFALQATPNAGRAEWQDVARQAEDLGYDTLQTADHIGAVDPFAPLLTAAAVTTRLKVGPLVLNNELHHPVLLARQAATVDLLTDGRLELGLGTGYAADEHEAIGQPISPPGRRVTRLEESVRIVIDLLQQGRASSRGEYRVEVADLGVQPVQRPRPPILIGADGPRLLRISARLCDIVQLTGLHGSATGTLDAGGFALDRVRESVAIVREAAGDRDVELAALVQRTDLETPDATMAALSERLHLQPSVLATTPFLMVGSAESICEKLVQLREELGFSYFTVRDATGFAPVVSRLAGS